MDSHDGILHPKTCLKSRRAIVSFARYGRSQDSHSRASGNDPYFERRFRFKLTHHRFVDTPILLRYALLCLRVLNNVNSLSHPKGGSWPEL